ncbi:MAG: GAF domain-containing protein [Lapillicoccus sp.]
MASRTTTPNPARVSDTAALRLLRLLANNGTVAEITDLDAPETERDLALRIREDFDRRRRREVELSALVETARDLASLSDPRGVLDAIVRRARTLLGTDIAYLTLFDPERGDTYMRATDGSISAEFQSVRLGLGDGLGGLAAKTRKAYWTADYFADHRFQHTGVIDHAVADEGIVAICGTPLIAVDDFVGVLFAANRSPRPFTHDEVALLGSLATLAAVSLVQARALAETELALAALSEAHETVRRHTAGVERAAAATTGSPTSYSGVAEPTTSPRHWSTCSAAGRSCSTTPAYGAAKPGGPPTAPPTRATATGSPTCRRRPGRPAPGGSRDTAAGMRSASRPGTSPSGCSSSGGSSCPPTTPTNARSSGPPWSRRWSCSSSGRPPTRSSRCGPTSSRTSSRVEATGPSSQRRHAHPGWTRAGRSACWRWSATTRPAAAHWSSRPTPRWARGASSASTTGSWWPSWRTRTPGRSQRQSRPDWVARAAPRSRASAP